MSGELFLEVRAEEIPARMLPGAVQELASRAFEELMTRGLGPSEVETGFTPRRLILTLRGVPSAQADREEDVLGPPLQAAWRDGAFTAAAEGFARRCEKPLGELGWARAQSGKVGEMLGGVAAGPPAGDGKGVYLVDHRLVRGRATSEVLSEVLPRLLAAISWAKTMRWGRAEGPWVRPVHGIVCVFDDSIVPFQLFGVEAGQRTVGHPILSPGVITVADSASYYRDLARLGLEPRFAPRRERLWAGVQRAAAGRGGRAVEDAELLDKLTAICEIPGVIDGDLPAAALELPPEVLQTSLRDHQSAFTAVDSDGRLLPAFFTVMDRPDDPSGRVRDGNEWVVAARLADAGFFFAEDRKTPLAERAAGLGRLTFHEKLGSYAEKAVRVKVLTGLICEQLGLPELKEQAATAAKLMKADLTTEMVKEFTSLQGVMGGIYARIEGSPDEVWQAIYDQYLPASATDALPRGPVGQVVGVADRVDSLVGLFGLGLVPTGSKDPFALRRAAHGVTRILIEGGWRCDLGWLVRQAHEQYHGKLKLTYDATVESLAPFFADRLRHLLAQERFAHDEIEAGLSRGAAVAKLDFAALRARVAALHGARDQPNFRSVVLAVKRIENILAGAPAPGSPYTLDLMGEPAEQALAAAQASLRERVGAAVDERNYRGVIAEVGRLAPVLDRFFTEILVMDPDLALRSNRLALLAALRGDLLQSGRLQELSVEKTP